MAVMVKTLVNPRKELYVVHKSNSPMIWPINDKSTIVSFSNINEALFIASLSESHYVSNKEWPTGIKFSFHKQIIPTILGVKSEDYEETRHKCALWAIDLLIIDEINEKSPLNFSFSGKVQKFDIDYNIQKHFLDNLYVD
jgi:hypothetical protein